MKQKKELKKFKYLKTVLNNLVTFSNFTFQTKKNWLLQLLKQQKFTVL